MNTNDHDPTLENVLLRESPTTFLPLGDLDSLETKANTHASVLRPRSFNGPISGKMWERVSALSSSYPDTFDWSVYDQIYNRFGENQPRGGVVFKTAMKLVNHHSSCSKCHHAFEIDAYGRGCIHNCAFCYAKDTLNAHGFWNRPMPFPIDLSEVRKIFHTVFETDKRSKWREILEKRVPLRFGSMSDSFMWMDRKYKVTQEILKILNFYDYPYIIFTRSDLVAHDDYLRLLNKDLVSVQMSISGGNEHLTRLIEPGAPSVAKRLKALETLADAGIWTTVRINPMFPIYPDGYFTDPKSIIERFGSLENAPKFELFDWNFIEQLKDAKVPSLLAGFVRLSSTALNSMSRETGVDMKAFFKPELLKGHGDKRFSDSEIAYYYKKVQAECIKQGIRFNTCYIGNGEKDYYQYQDLWANKKDCCDAVGNVRSFKTTSQTVPWETRIAHAPDKAMALQSIEQEKKLEVEFAHVLAKDVGLKRHPLKLVTNSKEA